MLFDHTGGPKLPPVEPGTRRRNGDSSALEQFRQDSAFLHQMERTAIAVAGVQIVDPQRVKHGSGDVFRADGVVLGVLGQLVAGTVDLTAANAAPANNVDMLCVQ